MLRILDTGIGSALQNMQFDEKLLEELDPKGDPILHLYQWSGPSATYGFFIDPEKHIDLEKAKKHHLSLARRPTGGGIVFHIWDLAFSFLMPSRHPAFASNTLENYRFVNQSVLEVMSSIFSLRDLKLTLQNFDSVGPNCGHFCMAKPTQYDVVYNGMKIAGAAQRKRRQGYLHQGTISLAYPHIDLLKDILLFQNEIVEAMMAYSFAPLERVWQPAALQEMRAEIQKRLAQNLMEKL